MKPIISLILLLFIHNLLLSQNVTVNGKVLDSITNQPIPGVNITIKGVYGIGTITDEEGRFSIEVPESSVLVFSFIGYNSKEVVPRIGEFMQITLTEELKELDEVIIVGASVKRSDLTGSVSNVTTEQLKNIPSGNLNQAIQGKISGVYIENNPAPGSKASIKIRGSNSIQFGTNPIYVIDGLVIDGGFEMLNPEDISNIEILKDASATAIYGSRGANGVVVITTKRGKKNKKIITVDNWMGYQSFSNEMPLLTGPETFDLRVDAYANAYMDKNPLADRDRYIKNSLTNTNPIKNLIFSKEELESYANGSTYNWLDQITRTGFQQNNAISFSGGNDDGTYYASFGYNYQKGQIQKTNYKRYTGKINIEQNLKEWLKFGSNNSYINTSEKPVPNDNMFITALRACPLLPVSKDYWYMKEGKIDNQSSSNPLRDLTIDRDIFSNRLLSSNYLNISPIGGLDIRLTYSVDVQQVENYSYYPTTSTQSYKSTYNGQSVQVKSKTFNYQWDNSVSFRRIFDGKHALNILLGSNLSFYSYNYNQQNASGYNNDLFSYKYVQGATDKDRFYLGSDFWTYSLMSYLLRINYSFNSRYYLTLTGRADGSSKFGPSNKWGLFPSVAGSWNITNEKFMKQQKIFSNLRLRIGYGIAGNQNIPNYGYLTRYNPSISLESNILTNSGRYGNPSLRWEKQKQINGGMDIGILNGMVEMSLDVFKINNEDLLMERSTAPSSGYLTQIDNVGALENKGFEYSLSITPFRRKNIEWNIGFNIASAKNTITKLYGDVTEIYNLGGYTNNEIQREGNLFLGKPLNTIYVYQFDHIAQESDMDYINSLEKGSRIIKPGDILPKDRDNNGIINDQDRYVFGKKDPDFYGGINTELKIFNFGISLQANYSKGAHRISYLYETLMSSIGTSAAHRDLLNRWTPENTNTNIPRAYSDGGRFNIWDVDWAVQDASFLRISYLTLSYVLPGRFLKSLQMNQVRVYFTGNNLFTMTKYKGYDPETGDWYPSSKMYILGFNIVF